jgi:uncharacterized protein (DUF2345 family)
MAAVASSSTREAQSQIEQSNQLQISMADLAQKQGTPGWPPRGARNRRRIDNQRLRNWLPVPRRSAPRAVASGGDSGGSGQVTAYSNPHLQLSAPAGIAAMTPVSAVLRSGTTSSLTAGQDINQVAQGNSMHLVKDGISLFSYGKASSADKPNQETGIRLHAASSGSGVEPVGPDQHHRRQADYGGHQQERDRGRQAAREADGTGRLPAT